MTTMSRDMTMMRRQFEPVMPTSVIGALTYVGVTAILLRDLHLWLSIPVWHRNLWNDFMWLSWVVEERSWLRWIFSVVGCLLVIYLWTQGRSFVARRIWPQATSCMLAAILVLALQWSVLASLDAVATMKYEILQVHP